jgi:hypothetical protein
MIVKYLKPAASFPGVFYNINKVDGRRAELAKAVNFRALSALSTLKIQDYINYLEMITSVNKRVEYPQLHVVISGKGRIYDKESLTNIGESWLKEMGYGQQPYLLVFHKDTNNNHLHIVSTRIDSNGRKISSGFEYRRSKVAINKILGYDVAMKYRFSTKAQFLMILKTLGYPGRDSDEIKVLERAGKFKTDRNRVLQIRELLEKHKADPGLKQLMKEKYGIDLLFHAAEGKQPYGYSIIDHDRKIAFKGGEVMPLRELLRNVHPLDLALSAEGNGSDNEVDLESTASLIPIQIADDVDDQQIHGMRRRRQKKARTNTR